MYIVADILLVVFVGIFLYRGITKGFMNTTFTLVTAILWIALAAGLAFAIPYFVFDYFGWLKDFQVGLIDFAQKFMGIFSLIGIEMTVADLAHWMAIGICTLVLFIPFYIFFLWVGRKFEDFVRFVRVKSVFLRVVGSVLAAIINVAVAGALVLGFYWLFAVLDGSGLFTYTNEVLRSGYITRWVYEYNPLHDLLGMEPGCLAETVGNILKGNF